MRQFLSLLLPALLAGCASRPVPPPVFQGLARLDSTEAKEKPLRTARLRDSASTRWCLSCGSPADSTVRVRVWGLWGNRKEFEDSVVYARTDLPRARSVDHFMGRPAWDRDSRTAKGFIEPNEFLSRRELWPKQDWKASVRLHSPHAGVFGRGVFANTWILLTPLVAQDGFDVLEIEGRDGNGKRSRWKRRLPLSHDTLQCDSLDSLTLCVELQRCLPADPKAVVKRFPEGPPWPDGRKTCWGVPGVPLDDRTFEKEREFAAAWRFHEQNLLSPDAFCRLEQLVSRVPNVECKPMEYCNSSPSVPVMDGVIFSCMSTPEVPFQPEPLDESYLEIMGREILKLRDDCSDLPAEVVDDWREIYELLRFADCRRKHPGDTIQCHEPKRLRP